MLPSPRTTSALARRRARLLPLGAATLILVAGCSGGAGDAESEPTPSEPATSSSESAAPTATFGFDGQKPGKPAGNSRTTLACGPTETYVSFNQLTVDHRVQLRSMEVVGAHVRTGRTWITDESEQISSSGLFSLEAPGPAPTQEPGWPSRVPVKDAVMRPGTVYTYFVELALGRHGAQTGYRLTYDLDGTPGEVTIPERLSRRPCR